MNLKWAKIESAAKEKPLIRLNDEITSSYGLNDFRKDKPYPLSRKIAVEFRPDGDIVFMIKGEGSPIILSNQAMTRLPFAVLSLRDIAAKLELFLEEKKGGNFPGAGFRLFILNVGLFDTFRETPLDGDTLKKTCQQVFMKNGSDSGELPRCGDLFQGMNVAPDLQQDFLLSEVTPNPGKNKLLIGLGGEYGGTYTIEIPLSYTRSMTRNDLVERFSVIHEKSGGDIVYFEEFLVNLAKLETVLGIFPNECLRPLVSILSNGPSLFYIEGSPKKRLFLQGSESLSRIEVVEAPLPGREKEARQKFLGEAVMKNRWTGKLWGPQSRDKER